MRILVINGECIQVNTSSNLCNLAYLRGLVATGHEVTLISADGKGYTIDPKMVIPKGVHCYTYRSMTLYEKLSRNKKRINKTETDAESAKPTSGCRRGLLTRLKRFVLSLYGVHGIYSKFSRKAIRFRSDETFDYVLSLCTPASSHLLAYRLLNSGHVKSRHWVQIWEDPWYSDVSGFTHNNRIFREERRLLSLAERVCYVSPLTLENQKKLYPEFAEKMFWEPLPAYYNSNAATACLTGAHTYGYFGDYPTHVRNLEPFYEAAKQTGVEVCICGNPGGLFAQTEKIHIHERMPLEELKPIEEQTGVLVFLCNRGGGQIPGKIYQYSATDKTILFILDGTEDEKKTIREYFERFNRYVFCDNTADSILEAIRRIETGKLDGIRNEPVSYFEPTETIRRILEGI